MVAMAQSRVSAILPSAAANRITRPRLEQRLPEILTRRLTLIEAPAGYGKTELLSVLASQLMERGAHVHWIAARASNPAQVKREIKQYLHEARCRGTDGDAYHLFLDDAHLLRGHDALSMLRELLERGPEPVRIVIGTRTQLELSVARWRGRGELAEIHASDLAFDSDEARRFLLSLRGFEPSHAEIDTLLAQSGGWPTALRLLSAPGGRAAIAEFLQEEVLAELDPQQRELLELLAVPDRICASLATALSRNQHDGTSIIRQAQARGLFLSALDVEPRWYALHPLLRDQLRSELAERDPQRNRSLHLAASEWFENAGMFREALDHAMRAGDLDGAARIFDLHGEDFYAAGLEQSILPYANRLPAAVRARYPRILLAMSFRLQAELQLDLARELLHAAQTRIEELAASGNCPAAELQLFQNQLLHRLITQAQCEGDFEFVEQQSRSLLRRFPDASPYIRGSLYAAMLHAQREQYELGQLTRLEALARAQLQQVESRYVLVFLDNIAAPGRLIRGQIDALIEGLTRSLELACQISGERSALGAVVALPLAEAWLERNESQHARALLDDYLPNATEAGFEDQLISGWLTDARLKRDAGDVAGALARLDETIGFANARGLHRLRVAAIATAIEFHCARGDRDSADSLAMTIGLKRLTPPEMPEGRITRTDAARAMAWTWLAAARGHHVDALAIARRWRARVSAAGAVRDRVRWEVRIATLKAAIGDERAARRSVHQALIAGAPGRLIRPFVEEARTIAPLLPAPLDPLAGEDFQSRFTAEVCQAVQQAAGLATPVQTPPATSAAPVDGLSMREVEILRLVAAGMLNSEIGAQLGLTEGSVKWYLQRIFDKVGIRRRMLAVEYARRLGLLNRADADRGVPRPAIRRAPPGSASAPAGHAPE